jgi:hypothetical protein
MKTRNIFFAAASSLLISAGDAAPFTGSYSFTDTTGNVASLPYNGGTLSNVNVGALDKIGVTTSSSIGNSRASGWAVGATSGSDSFSGTVDLGKYFEFSLSAADGYTIDMTSVTFGIGRSAAGPRQWQWRSSADNYTAAIQSYSSTHNSLGLNLGVIQNTDSNSSWTGNVLNLNSDTYSGLSAITLRFYGYNAEATGGTGGLQGNLSFAGIAVESIPEPSAALLGGLGILGAFRRRRR